MRLATCSACSKDLFGFMQSLSRVRWNRASKRKALLTGWLQLNIGVIMFQHIEFVTHVSYGFPPKPAKQSGHSQPQSAGLSSAFQKYYYNKSQHREDLLKSEYNLGMRGFRDGPSGIRPPFFFCRILYYFWEFSFPSFLDLPVLATILGKDVTYSKNRAF